MSIYIDKETSNKEERVLWKVQNTSKKKKNTLNQ